MNEDSKIIHGTAKATSERSSSSSSSSCCCSVSSDMKLPVEAPPTPPITPESVVSSVDRSIDVVDEVAEVIAESVAADLSTETVQETLQSKFVLKVNLDQKFRKASIATTSSNTRYNNNQSRRSSIAGGVVSIPANTSRSSITGGFVSNTNTLTKTAAASTAKATTVKAKHSIGITDGGDCCAPSTKPPPPPIPLPPPPSSSSSSTTGKNRFQVFLRVRPSTERNDDASKSTITILSETCVRVQPPSTSNKAGETKEFTFDRVLPPTLSQLNVYEQTAAPLVSRIFEGHSALLFCYGVTNAGKSYTVHGEGNYSTTTTSTSGGICNGSSENNDPSDVITQHASLGIFPRLLNDMFVRMKSLSSASSSSSMQLSVSFFEIYQNQFYDLLPACDDVSSKNKSATHPPKVLRLRTDNTHGKHPFVEGLATHNVTSVRQALAWVKTAKNNRRTATNAVNETSSRSHSIYQLTIHTRSSSNTPSYVSSSSPEASFWVVDLAGNERSKRTACTGQREKEAVKINQSLMVLMRCLNTLKGPASSSTLSNHNNHELPPFRESKLTHLLMNHWGESSTTSTAMIVNVNPAASDFDESQHVLNYATQAKKIQLPPPPLNPTGSSTDNTKLGMATTVTQYDQNGRRVQVSSDQISHKSNDVAAAGVKRKLPHSSKSLRPTKSTAIFTKSSVTATRAVAAPSFPGNKRMKRDIVGQQSGGKSTNLVPIPPPTSMKTAYKLLKSESEAAEMKIQSLQNENQKLVECIESESRKIQDEMDAKLMQQRQEFEEEIRQLRLEKAATHARGAASYKSGTPLQSGTFESSADTIKRLEETLRVVRNEMTKMQKRVNFSEMAIKRAVNESAGLRKELAEKVSLIANYKLLLEQEEVVSDNDDDNDNCNSESGSEDEELDEVGQDDSPLTQNGRHSFQSESKNCSDNSSSVMSGSEDDDDDDCDDEVSTATVVICKTYSNASAEVRESVSVHDDAEDGADGELSAPASLLPTVEFNSHNLGDDVIMDTTNVDDLSLYVNAKSDEQDDSIHESESSPSSAKDNVVNSVPDYDTRDSMVADATQEFSPPLTKDDASLNVYDDDDARGLATRASMMATKESISSALGDELILARSYGINRDGPSSTLIATNLKDMNEEHSSSSACAMKPPMPHHHRKPLGSIVCNKRESVLIDDDPNMYLPSKNRVKKDPLTGLYKRPPGRPPANTTGWCTDRGMWRVSMS